MTMQHFGGLTERVQVPKTVRYRTAEILASQPRLTSQGGQRAAPLAARDFFLEAVAYLEFMVGLTGENREAFERVRALPSQATGASQRGRRHRRGKGQRARRG